MLKSLGGDVRVKAKVATILVGATMHSFKLVTACAMILFEGALFFAAFKDGESVLYQASKATTRG